MKIAFSTIACPEWSFTKEILPTAKDFCYDGIEVRGIHRELYAPNISIFSEEQLQDTKTRLKEAGIEISCLTSGACLAKNGGAEAAISEGKAYIDLAAKLGVKFIRVMPTQNPYPDDCNVNQAQEIYTLLAIYGENKGVTPLMETNGVFADTAALKKFMENVACENVGVLWDINHPVRFNNESVEQTLKNVGKFIKYVHIKDSVAEDGVIVYKLVGRGTLPISEAVDALRGIGYEGYLSLEWVRLWNKNLEEPGLVLPHYSNYIKNIL